MAEMCGYLKKRSRGSGFGVVIANWKERYFQLRDGVLKYYKNERDPTEGISELGNLILVDAQITENGCGTNRIHVKAQGEERDIILEAETEEIAFQWQLALRDHIKFASSDSNRKRVLRR